MSGEDTQGEEGPSEDIEMLIEKVREHAVIYDPTLPDYKNSGRKDLLWINIASELNKEGTIMFLFIMLLNECFY